jgi:signal transduction histidine kinase/integral membrane sensor domain MASE1
VVALAYLLGSVVGLSLQFSTTQISVFWPPNAILLAALLLAPRSRWWLYLGAVLPVHLLIQLSMGIALPATLVNFAGNAGEALLGAFLVDLTLPEPRRFDQLRAVTLVIVCGGLLAPAVVSLVVSTVFAQLGLIADLWLSWRLRVLTNALAVTTLVPPLLVALSPPARARRHALRGRAIEGTALLGALAVVSAVVFLVPEPGPAAPSVLLYLPFPLLLWAALRFGLVGVSISVSTLGGFALIAAVRDRGPFATPDPASNATSLLLFLLVSGIPLLLLAAVLNERETVDAGRREIEMLHGAVLGSLRDQIAVLDRDGLIREVNGAWQESGGAAPGRHYLADWSQQASDASYGAEPMTTGIEAVLHGERERFSAEILSVHSPGEWLELSAESLPHSEGGAVLTVSDITARKQAEWEAREQRGALAHLTRVATLGEISGALAHELSQPLTAILSNAQAAQRLLARSPPDLNEIRSILSDIVVDDRRAGEVIQRLRAMLRKEEPQLVALDLNEVIGDVLALERSDLISRRVTVRQELASDLPAVRGDRIQLQQVFLNLFVNACQAMATTPAPERRLDLATARDGDWSRVTISDRGTGIDASSIERVFEPFFTTKRQGLGLGLSICRSIVEDHGGRLWASNNEHVGATFHLALPICDREANDAQSS